MNFGLIAAVRGLLSHPNTKVTEQPPPEPATEQTSITPGAALPPPVDLGDMPEDLRQIVVSLSQAIPSVGSPVVPTLYRHLAIWPDLMRHLAPGILAVIDNGEATARMGELGSNMASLSGDITARARNRNLTPPPIEDPEALTKTLDAFLFAIPHMIVVGAGLGTGNAAFDTTVAFRLDAGMISKDEAAQTCRSFEV